MRGQILRKLSWSRLAGGASLVALGAALGCQSFSSPNGEFEDDDSRASVKDGRKPVVQAVAPPPISGGTLLALSDARSALVSDPDRDRILIVDYKSRSILQIFQLEQGAEPGRAVEDRNGTAYVVLRGPGEIATIDLKNLRLQERRKVCSLPRGVALDSSTQRLLVACAEGKLVELGPTGGVTTVTPAPLDVRDVVLTGQQIAVSRFRSAEVLKYDMNRSLKTQRPLPYVNSQVRSDSFGTPVTGQFKSDVAWRMVGHTDGSVVVVHQLVTTETVDVHPDASSNPVVPQSSYGGSTTSGCGGIVQSAVSVIKSDGTTSTSPQLAGSTLPVDVAVSSLGTIAVASAGPKDPEIASSSPFLFSSSIRILGASEFQPRGDGSCLSPFSSPAASLQDPVVAVAWEPGGAVLLAQTRQPSQLVVLTSSGSLSDTLDLGGADVTDTGHEIFHRDSGSGLACASCHAEGKDDGHTWKFSDTGERRTQPLDIGLEGTQPFHWDGNLKNLNALMGEVFVSRMGGPIESPARVDATTKWIFQQKLRAPVRPVSDPAAQRGKALFESATVGCATCHTGEKLTSSGNRDVGTGGSFQVPSLLGAAHRLPLMHNGCAVTLQDRFNESCGGALHGNTAQLNADQINDMVAYLESI